jgi:hypothetical protein
MKSCSPLNPSASTIEIKRSSAGKGYYKTRPKLESGDASGGDADKFDLPAENPEGRRRRTASFRLVSESFCLFGGPSLLICHA